ncbi:MAG TPA: PIG-L family deacetylase [Pyrinomonadaceae bacterium]|nr:PIG-L family deacetylase [Pyrinomonadaceae bacterium]
MNNSSPRFVTAAALLLSIFCLSALPARAQPPEVLSASETQLTLKKLQVLGSALYVAAHPDDENTALLAYLASERGVRAAYLSVTRGDGGQNLIGTEKGALLGLLRTQELLAARRVDGAEQFFTRAVDFGFTKSAEETLRIWGREAALADVVWVIRRFRPDVIITRFPTTGEGGHGQHTASAILAREAFDAAGDPARFPEQLRHVKPWKPKRILWNAFSRAGERPKDADRMPSADVGAYNPLLGKSYTEIAAQSRSQHKSQGFGSAERRGASVNYFTHLAGEEARADIFDGVDLSWRRVAGGEAVGRLLQQAASEYRASNPQAILPLLLRAQRELSKLQGEDAPLLEAKREQLSAVIRSCAGLWAEAVAAEPYATPGADMRVNVTLVNRSDFPLRLEQVAAGGGALREVGTELKNNQPSTTEVIVPAPRAYSQPYWLRAEPGAGMFVVAEQALVGEPSALNPMRVLAVLGAGTEGDKLRLELPVLFRWTDRVQGELYRPVAVVPPVAVNLPERVLVFPDRAPKQLQVSLRSNVAAETKGTLRLKLPAGWSSAPASLPVTLTKRDEELKVSFNVTPPANASQGTLAAEFETGGQLLSEGFAEIDYPHITRQTLFPPAEARLVRVDLQRRGGRVGYVMGSGDEIPEALRQVGYDVTLLSDEDLENADLGKFDAVIAGVRAYNTRAALRRQQRRLLEYVERGGTYVVQYNTSERALDSFGLGPYPFKLSPERVTVEEAPVALLAPQDALLNEPNRITPADFDGWVQERGLYFPSEWDARYQPLFASHDPGEAEKRGSTLVARHGRGTYIYTSLAWFRQLPAGVPGAYRLFVNLISAGKR